MKNCFHRTKLFSIFSFLTVSLFVSPLVVYAIGIGVSPAKIESTVIVDESVTHTVYVKNISGAPSEYEIYADDLKSWFSFTELKFTLGIDEKKQVDVTITPSLVGEYNANLSVVSFYVDKQTFNAGSGVKVPVRITVYPAKKILGLQPVVFIALLAVLVVFILFAILSIRQRREEWKNITRKVNKK